MKSGLNYCRHADCKRCMETTNRKFRYIETEKGEKYIFEMAETYTIVFILSGAVLLSCNEYAGASLQAEEVALWFTNSNHVWEAVTNTTSIVFTGNNIMIPYDRKVLAEHTDNWLNTIPGFRNLPIKPQLMEFLYSVKNYLDDGIACPYMHECKEWELSLIFRTYYSQEELMSFFLPAVYHARDFELFVMNNYLKIKGVKEFVDLSGMNLSAFNRKFKAHFKESPYQWLIKQRSKHIYHALTSTNKSFAIIAKEFYFTDASHFNHYCKSMFGDSPSKIREKSSEKAENSK